jgi:hypothetical protein
MRHNLTALFNNQGDAQRVLDELLVAGYSCAGPTLVSPPSAGGVGQTLGISVGGGVKQMLIRLFGAPPHHEPDSMDQSACLPGRHVITISGAVDLDSVRAISIIERSNPVYIEDRHKQVQRDPVHVESPLIAEQPLPAHKRNAGYPAGTAPGALQAHFHDDSHLFGTQNANNPRPCGTTYQEAMGSGPAWNDRDDGRGLHVPQQSFEEPMERRSSPTQGAPPFHPEQRDVDGSSIDRRVY